MQGCDDREECGVHNEVQFEPSNLIKVMLNGESRNSMAISEDHRLPEL